MTTTTNKNTAARKFDTIARDSRVAAVRPATFEESNGERGWVMFELAAGCTYQGAGQFIACGVTDARTLLDAVAIADD